MEEVQIRPFRAWFQTGSPTYAPKGVRFTLGGPQCFDSQGRRLPSVGELEAAGAVAVAATVAGEDARRAAAGAVSEGGKGS